MHSLTVCYIDDVQYDDIALSSVAFSVFKLPFFFSTWMNLLRSHTIRLDFFFLMLSHFCDAHLYRRMSKHVEAES